MVEFGDELMMVNYRIPWLIWIQLLVTIFLILLLFFGLTVFISDPSTTSAAASSGSPATGCNIAPPTHLNNPNSSNTIIMVEEQREGRDESNGEDDHQSRETSDSMILSIFHRPNHPCNYIGLAKQALFKCFGIDSSSEGSTNLQHEKHD